MVGCGAVGVDLEALWLLPPPKKPPPLDLPDPDDLPELPPPI